MIALLIFLFRLLVLPSGPEPRPEAENAALRQQVAILQRKVRGRVQLTNSDRLFFVLLYRWFPSALKAMTIIQPETLVRWHRAGFRYYWRWKSRNLGGRPPISAELRALIRRMSFESTLWGAPHIHGELLKVLPTRKPTSLSRKPVAFLRRWAERRNCGLLYQEPPRATRRLQSPPVFAVPSVGAPL
jgi:hypothetical protein